MLTRILENTFNHLLASDYQGKQRLALHQGKSVGFNIKRTGQARGLTLIATITREGLNMHSGSLEQCDCSISGSPVALIRYMNAPQINPSTNQSLGIEIDGDLEFAREISSVFRSLDIDWEEIFFAVCRRWTGPSACQTFLQNIRDDIQKKQELGKSASELHRNGSHGSGDINA